MADTGGPAGLHRPAELLAGVLLAGVILCAGTLPANLLRQRGGELVAEQVFLQAETRAEGAEEVSRSQVIELFKEYVFAFADAAIQFDTVPKFDPGLVYNIASALPDGVEITAMAFFGRNIGLSCTTRDPAQAIRFAAHLREEGRFDSALTGTLTQTEDGAWSFVVTCVPKLETGQLSLNDFE